MVKQLKGGFGGLYHVRARKEAVGKVVLHAGEERSVCQRFQAQGREGRQHTVLLFGKPLLPRREQHQQHAQTKTAGKPPQSRQKSGSTALLHILAPLETEINERVVALPHNHEDGSRKNRREPQRIQRFKPL